MVHYQKITEKQLENFQPFPFLVKGDRPYAPGDLFILDEHKEEDNSVPTMNQLFFNIETITTSDQMKGIKKGFVILRLKRTSFKKISETMAEGVKEEK
jgi:hypothetical protein